MARCIKRGQEEEEEETGRLPAGSSHAGPVPHLQVRLRACAEDEASDDEVRRVAVVDVRRHQRGRLAQPAQRSAAQRGWLASVKGGRGAPHSRPVIPSPAKCHDSRHAVMQASMVVAHVPATHVHSLAVCCAVLCCGGSRDVQLHHLPCAQDGQARAVAHVPARARPRPRAGAGAGRRV